MVRGRFAFTRTDHVMVDGSRDGVKRAKTPDISKAEVDEDAFELHICEVLDCASLDDFTPSLEQHGFAHVGLESVAGLPEVLERIRVAGQVSDDDAAQVRRCLKRASLPLPGGKRLRVLHIAREGFIMRRAGPDGTRLDPDGPDDAMNNHHAAQAVHIDQDVDGTPLRQLMRGTAPYLFAHDSPAHANTRSPLHVLNLWIPLDQLVAPLALLDRNTLDRREHQLRYGLPTDTFLERKDSMKVNDIWSLLHHEDQRWYFTSDMDARRGYVFETLSTAHGAFILPGEDVAAVLQERLGKALEALDRRDVEALRDAAGSDEVPAASEGTPEPLSRAIAHMRELLGEVAADPSSVLASPQPWRERAEGLRTRLIRKSIEMRIVALVVPDVWPLRWL